MSNDNELKQVQEPPQEEQQQPSSEQKPAEAPPPEAQLAERRLRKYLPKIHPRLSGKNWRIDKTPGE